MQIQLSIFVRIFHLFHQQTRADGGDRDTYLDFYALGGPVQTTSPLGRPGSRGENGKA